MASTRRDNRVVFINGVVTFYGMFLTRLVDRDFRLSTIFFICYERSLGYNVRPISLFTFKGRFFRSLYYRQYPTSIFGRSCDTILRIILYRANGGIIRGQVSAYVVYNNYRGRLKMARDVTRYLKRVVSYGIVSRGAQASFNARFVNGLYSYYSYITMGKDMNSRSSIVLQYVKEPNVVRASVVSGVFDGGQSIRQTSNLSVRDYNCFRGVLGLRAVFSGSTSVMSSYLVIP